MKIIGIFVAVIVLVGLGWVAYDKKNDTALENSKEIESDGGDVIKLSSTPSGVYVPKEIRVKVGTKVRIEGDTKTLVDGMDTVIIDGYNLKKVISPKDNTIEFVADKAGTFKMYCANGMGNGMLIVE